MTKLPLQFLLILAASLTFGQGAAADVAPQGDSSSVFRPTSSVISPDSAIQLFPVCGPDPWMLRADSLNYYYMHSMMDSLVLWHTTEPAHVAQGESRTVWRPTPGSPYAAHVWAPEIHRLQGKWYIYFAADDGNSDHHQMYVLENASPDPMAGDWVFKGRLSTDPLNNWAIDGSVFERGSELYFVWSGWQKPRVDIETQCIYIARMANPWTLASPRIRISTPQLPWERHDRSADGTNIGHRVFVNEGPQPLWSPDSTKIHIAYSASGCWTEHYALGLLTADADADLLEPSSWQKSPVPVFRQDPEAGVFGTGHCSFFTTPDGSPQLLYHARSTLRDPDGMGDTRNPRFQPFSWSPDAFPLFGSPLPPRQP